MLSAYPYIPLGSSILSYGLWAVLYLATILTKTAFSGMVYDNAAERVDEEFYSGDVEL